MVEKRKLFLYFLFFFKNCTSLGPNWSILLGSWKGQIEKKFQSRIHRGQFRFWRGRNGTCPARFGSNSPKRTLMGQTGPREIGANLAFGVNLALFILRCIFKHSTHYLFSDWPKEYSEFSKSTPGTSSSCRLYNNHVKDTQCHW